MIEMGGKEIPEDAVMEGLTYASEEIEKLQKFQKEIIAKRGKTKRVIELAEIGDDIKALFAEKIGPKFISIIFAGVAGRAHPGAYSRASRSGTDSPGRRGPR